MVVERKQEHIYRVVRALADILRVAVEMGDVHQASKDDDAVNYPPAFRDPTFLDEIVDTWLKYWYEEDHHGGPEWLVSQVEELSKWLEDLIAEMKTRYHGEES